MQTIDNLSERFTSSVLHPDVIRLFRKCLYIFIFLHTLIRLPVAAEFWGPGSLLPAFYNSHSPLFCIFDLLHYDVFKNLYWFFIAAQLLLILVSFLIKPQRLITIGVYFFTAVLHNKNAIIENNGESLALVLLLLLIFMNENKSSALSNAITNFAFLAAQVQIAFAYFAAGMLKLKGVHWMDGTALYYALMNDDYTCGFAKHYLAHNSFFIYAGTWLTLFLQLGFPVLIWFKKTKRITLALGILVHLLIIFLMGITDFGVIMLIAYILFMKNETAGKVLGWKWGLPFRAKT